MKKLMALRIFVLIFVITTLGEADTTGIVVLNKGNLVRLDKGTIDGVVPGSKAIIRRDGELIALINIISVQTSTSIGKIAGSNQNVLKGDRAEFQFDGKIEWSKLKTDESNILRSNSIGKISIENRPADLYQQCSNPRDSYKLSGPKIETLKMGTIVTLLEIIPGAYGEGGFTRFYKVKTNNGNIGFIDSPIKYIEKYGDRGELISIYNSSPYEYECFVEEVDKMIAKYNGFLLQYPNSKYRFYALRALLSLSIYPMQCNISKEDKLRRTVEIHKIYKEILSGFVKSEKKAYVSNIIEREIRNYKNYIINTDMPDYDRGLRTVNKNIVDNLNIQLCPSPFGDNDYPYLERLLYY